MTGNVPKRPPDAVAPATCRQETANGGGVSGQKGNVVGTIPVVVRERVLSRLDPPLNSTDFQKAPPSPFDAVWSCATPEEARETIVSACGEGFTVEAAYAEFLRHLRASFVTSGRRAGNGALNRLHEDPVFEGVVIGYLKKMVPEIFKHQYSRSLYEDIEFGLFLLGSAESFDVLEDIRHGGMRGIAGLFAKRHSAISRGLVSIQESVKTPEPSETAELRLRSFERNVEGFEQLCEIINKIAAMHSISALDRGRAFSLIQLIGAQIEVVGNELETIGYDQFVRDRLRFIEGKLLGNYSHLEFIDGRTQEEIFRKADRICHEIERGFRLQKATGFGGVPQREGIATSVMLGNIAFVRLTACQKAKRLGALSQDMREMEREWTETLFRLYAEASGSGKTFSNADEVATDFVNRKNHDEFMIETIHHLTLFCDLSADTLCRIATKLISDNQYSNAFHEEFKIKLFSIILEKLRTTEQSGCTDRAERIANWIREYARKNEKASGLVMSFSQLYISLAVFLSFLRTESAKQGAMECYLRASRVTDESWHVKFAREETMFLDAIGGVAELERFEKYHSVEKEREIHGQLLALIAQAVHGTRKDEANRSVCEIIEEFFYGICTAEIRSCECEAFESWMGMENCEPVCDAKIDPGVIRRGNRHVSIAISQGHYLLLQYPANLETVFNRILDQRKDFIRTNLSSLLAIVMKDRELSEANQYLAAANAKLDRQMRTDELTGLPNMREYVDNLPHFADLPNVASLLVQIDNLSDINNAYGRDTGNAFVQRFASGIVREFFGNPEHWKVYRTAPKEFLVIGDYRATEGVLPFAEIVPYFYELCSVFTLKLNELENNELCLRARTSISYSDQIKTDIYQKLHIAMQDTSSGPKVVSFDESRHSEERVRRNLEGGTAVTEAMKERRIIPYYQAIINNRTGKVEKYECLARMIGKDGEVYPPATFINHAKQAGTIPLLTQLMFERACQDFSGLETKFSINISWQDLADPDLVRQLVGTMEKYDVNPGRVTLEILEEALLTNQGEYAPRIAELKRIGCKIALDDFGSEGSNFSRFEKDWWPDIIKIDGPSFIRGLEKSPEKQRIVRAIVKAAKELGCEIVAEFVDSDEAWRLVAEMGIEYSQGYRFHEPQGLAPGESLPDAFDITEMQARVRTAVADSVA